MGINLYSPLSRRYLPSVNIKERDFIVIKPCLINSLAFLWKFMKPEKSRLNIFEESFSFYFFLFVCFFLFFLNGVISKM